MTSRIPPQKGAGFRLRRGQSLVVTDPLGEQVSDLFCFTDDSERDALSSGRSIDYNETIRFTAGHTLWSNRGRELLTITEDTCGTHDFLVTPCNLQMFRMIARQDIEHPSCFSNLAEALQGFDFPSERITCSFNIFMNVPVIGEGKIQVLPPLSKPGNHVRFRALCDLIVGLTACSDEGTNNGTCKPIDYQIIDGQS